MSLRRRKTQLYNNVLRTYNKITMNNQQLVKHLDKKFEAIDQRFDKNDEVFKSIDKRFDQIDKRFDAQDKTIDNIAVQVVKNSEDITDIRKNMATKEELRDVIGSIEKLAKKVDDLDTERLAAIDWLKRHDKEIAKIAC